MARNDFSMRDCPKCHSTNLQSEPIYDWDDGLSEDIALFCVTCGYYFGEFPSEIHQRGENLHNRLLSQLGGDTSQNFSASELESYLLGRRAATPNFD